MPVDSSLPSVGFMLGINLSVKTGLVYLGRLTLNVVEGLVLPIFFSANQDRHHFAATIPAFKDWFDVCSCMSGPLGINLPVKAGVVYVGRLTLNVFEGIVLPIFSRPTRTAIPSPRRYWLSLTYGIQSDDGVPIRITSGQTATCSMNDTDDW